MGSADEVPSTGDGALVTSGRELPPSVTPEWIRRRWLQSSAFAALAGVVGLAGIAAGFDGQLSYATPDALLFGGLITVGVAVAIAVAIVLRRGRPVLMVPLLLLEFAAMIRAGTYLLMSFVWVADAGLAFSVWVAIVAAASAASLIRAPLVLLPSTKRAPTEGSSQGDESTPVPRRFPPPAPPPAPAPRRLRRDPPGT